MKIAFLGDIALVGQFDKSLSEDTENKLKVLKDMLSSSDYVIANLESPLTDRKKTLVCKSMHLRSNSINVETLKYLGIDAVTLANNHVLDFGRKGLNDTIRTLASAQIEWYGIDGKYLQIEKEEKISLSGFCCYSTNGVGYTRNKKSKGVNLLSLESVSKQVESDKKNGYVSLISSHWGIEHTNYPAYEHIKLADKLAKMNQVVIHGHHPHAIQGIQQKENGSVIAYSLGNAIFDTTTSINGKFQVKMNEQNRKSFVLWIEIINGKIVSCSYEGFYIGDNGIIPYDITKEVEEISEKIVNIADMNQYENMRMEQYRNVIQSKFGKHDLKWVLSRLNYYSIGAKLMLKPNAKKYKNEVVKFME
jgi:poly-gamma-glutamate synthesis protein (capsule biosynthesis protein)